MLVVVFLLAISVVVLSISHYTYRICFYSPDDREEDPYSLLDGEQYQEVGELICRCTAIMEKTPFRWIQIRSFDNTTLRGRYYHNRDGAPLMLLFHGYRSCALRDCAGGFVLAKKLGFNVLAVDQRAHGGSCGKTIAFGILERHDCLCWADFATQHLSHDAPLLLSGLSMGAATVLMASQLTLPETVVGIIADCPYSSPGMIIQKVCADRRIPPKLAFPFILLGARIYGGFNLQETSALEAVKKAKMPLLLLHGEDDRFVPCNMSQDICDASNGNCQLYTFPNAGHGLSYMADPVRYEYAISSFLHNIPAMKPWLPDHNSLSDNTE